MNILIVRCYPGKVNLNQYNLQELGLAEALIRRGHSCGIIYWTDGESSYQVLESGVKIHWVHGSTYILDQVKYDYDMVKKISNSYDVMQLSEYNQLFTLKCLLDINIPKVIYHGPYKNSIYKKGNIYNWVFDKLFLNIFKRKQPRILCKSRIAEKELNNKGLVNTVTVGVGLNVKWNRKENTNIVNNRLLYIGSICERRNVMLILEALRIVLKEIPDIKLTIIGKGEGDYFEDCRRYIKEHKLSNYVEYYESKSQGELKEYYESSSLFLLPSSYEIFGMVLLESMFFGVPVLSSYNGGSCTVIKNNQNGFIENKLDSGVWAKKIIEILSAPEKHRVISRNSMATIDTKYTWDSLCLMFLENYERVVMNADITNESS